MCVAARFTSARVGLITLSFSINQLIHAHVGSPDTARITLLSLLRLSVFSVAVKTGIPLFVYVADKIVEFSITDTTAFHSINQRVLVQAIHSRFQKLIL